MTYVSPDESSAFVEEEHSKNQNNNNNQNQKVEAEYRDKKEQLNPASNTGGDLYYATEELLDGLPKLWTRGVLYVLLGFVFIGLPWATLSRIDETGSAKGRIEPKGSTRKLDSRTGGSVKAVKVKEGDTVKSGQILLELDSDILQTELQQAKARLSGLENQKAQLHILKNQLSSTVSIQEQQNQSQALEKMAQVQQARQNLDAKQSAYRLQKLEKQALLNQVEQQIKINSNEQQFARKRLDIDSKRVNRFSRLVKDGAVSENQVDQLVKEQQESKRRYDRSVSDGKQARLRFAEETSRYRGTMNQLSADIEQAKLRLKEQQNSYQGLLKAAKLSILRTQEQLEDTNTQIASTQSQIAQTRSQITSLNIQLQQRIVRSPIDGIVFELSVSKPGEVLQPGQRIAQIAPENTGVVLKANMPVQDSGFLKVGMPVKVKFDAYPYQEYGIVEGKVAWVSPDSKAQPTPQGITLDKQYVEIGEKRVSLSPGQTADAEVIIRQRRIIDFVLDPFKKLQKDKL
ncbi:MAG: HlyD family efflux transporter periplasmic adaptor subunit [Rivularia sp. ALOHA_DT_140]|nr:HlyD family efflux transporter periplasmic adaptor subunit [Rivularia sp. ALOHA_DT_140]